MKQIFAFLIVALVLPTAAFAADKQPSPCAADAKKLCADVKPGGGKIIACLRTHESDVSADCKVVLDKKKPS